MKPMLVAFGLLVIFILAPWSQQAVRAAEEKPDCAPGPGRMLCLAEQGDSKAFYLVAREAYEEGRKSGDLTRALEWATKSANDGDRSGRKLLKMVYVELGLGVHRDFVQAYVWLTQAIADGHTWLPVWRDKLAEKMNADQIAQAQKLAGN
jgi:TPR repeat protein